MCGAPHRAIDNHNPEALAWAPEERIAALLDQTYLRKANALTSLHDARSRASSASLVSGAMDELVAAFDGSPPEPDAAAAE